MEGAVKEFFWETSFIEPHYHQRSIEGYPDRWIRSLTPSSTVASPFRSRIKGTEEVELQRLFSTFPGGWPGVGLLLLRALVAFMLIAQGLTDLKDWSSPGPVTLLAGALAVACGFGLLTGFLTPIAGVLVAIGSLGFAFSTFAEPAFDALHGKLVLVNVIVISMAIVLLGPGAFSLDALMFGRREISIPQSLYYPRPK